MPRIAPIHWRIFEKFLLAVGCRLEREHGDHRIYWRNDLKRPVVIPREDQLPVFVVRNNLRVLGISVREYLAILKDL
ncbi:MAG: type II toxin-antitoxin system HicA family toxin [Parcubacteria group bacterium]|nr:type II toxin-antitoxin system HicA family toxin [Parcubacteria group bacterium]